MKEVLLSEVVEINPRYQGNNTIDPSALVSFVPMASVGEDGSLNVREMRPISEVKKGFTYFENGDVLVAKITPCFENGKATMVNNLESKVGFGSTEFHVLRPSKQIDQKYLFYAVWNPKFREVGADRMTGSAGQKRVPTDYLRNYKIPLPDLSEQRRIATILDKADAIRRKRRQAIVLMNDFLRSVFLEMFGDPIVNDRGWDKKPLGELFPEKGQIVDGPFGSTLKPECYVPTGIRVIRNFNIKDDCFDTSGYKFITEEKFQEISRSEVRAGDLLISTKGTVGNVCEMPTLSGRSVLSASGTVRIRFAPSSAVECSFLVSQMVLPQIKKYIQSFQAGSNQKYLNLSSIRKIEIVVPPLEVQHKFLMIKRAKLLAMSKVEKAEEYASNLCSALTSQLLG
jgi:type I restriction enzyme S subunit